MPLCTMLPPAGSEMEIPLYSSAPEGADKKKTTSCKTDCPEKLPDLDSNQDSQNQNLKYYHYTIGQLNLRQN